MKDLFPETQSLEDPENLYTLRRKGKKMKAEDNLLVLIMALRRALLSVTMLRKY